MRKQILIIHTGGTIGMNKSDRGYVPQAGFLQEQLDRIPELNDPQMPQTEIMELDPLLDSANVDWEHWISMAKAIKENYDRCDGFVVLHGTDTLSYSASALQFMLQGLGKPVVFTGSQIPLCEFRNDARENLITSIFIAANFEIPEVCVCFGDFLLRGCRSTKIRATGFDAFGSPNFPPLGNVGTEIEINWSLVRQPNLTELSVGHFSPPPVASIRLFPGISPGTLENLCQDPLKGLVIEAFGVGNCPSHNADFLRVLRNATDRGLVVVARSQCLEGEVKLETYEAGRALADVGATSGFDMTNEAALTKLFYLLNLKLEVAEVRKEVARNLVGELTTHVSGKA